MEYDQKKDQDELLAHSDGDSGFILVNFIQSAQVRVRATDFFRQSTAKTIKQRIDEINSLASAHVATYLTHEDPINKNQEKTIFKINLGNFNFNRENYWNRVVEALMDVAYQAGLNPRYVKNDQTKHVFIMRQYLLSSQERAPDELFSFELRYVGIEEKEVLAVGYLDTLRKFEHQLAYYQTKLSGWFLSKKVKNEILSSIHQIEQEKSFYVGTHSDPRTIQPGLILSIASHSAKDAWDAQAKMQAILTRFLFTMNERQIS